MHFLGVCVCIKNERPFMAEFVRHYLSQGADHIYIVDNGSTDGGVEDLPECADRRRVTVIRDARDMRILADDSGGTGHCKLLTENLFVRLRNECEWCVSVDADEFMFGKNGHTLRTYLQSDVPADVNRVYVFWNIISPAFFNEGDAADDATDTTAQNGGSGGGVLGQSRRRINYDRFYNRALLSDNARFSNRLGKSIFRPMRTDLFHGLNIHKVFVHGRAITNYGDPAVERDEEAWDHRPLVAHSEAAYAALNVTLHHYALRNRADCAKKRPQLETVRNKTAFILGLFDLMQCRDALAFVSDDDLLPPPPVLATLSATAVVAASTPLRRPLRCRWTEHRTAAASVLGFLDAFQIDPKDADPEEGTGRRRRWVRLVGWALSVAEGSRPVRFTDGDGAVHQILAPVPRPDVARAFDEDGSGGEEQHGRTVACGWDQHVLVRVRPDGPGVLPGGLEMLETAPDGSARWTRFMQIQVQH